jgi:CRP-like cAMP-binding protein
MSGESTQFRQLLALAREMSFLKGARLVRQGEASRGAYLIRSGTLEAHVALPGGGTLTVAQFVSGDMFGEMSLIERGVCSATVIAQSNVNAYFVNRDDFRAMVASRDAEALEMQRTITRTLSDKLRALNDRVAQHPAAEDRPAVDPAPASDPLAAVPRSRQASFDWRAYLPVLPFFEGFDEQEADEFVADGKVMELPRGAWVFAAGLPAQACFLVIRGAIEVFTRSGADAARGAGLDRRVAIAGPGELVGFMGVLRGAVHAGNARVRESCCLLEIPGKTFLEIYGGNSGTSVSMHQAIHRSLMRSITRTNTQLTRLISHARLHDANRKAEELEAALHGQIFRST